MPDRWVKAKIAARVATVGAHCAWERFFPGTPHSAQDVPHSWRQITPEWLTAVLCSDVPGGRVLALQATGGSVGTSTRHGLSLTLNDAARAAGVPERVFTKSTDKFTQRLLLGLAGVIGGEIDFYRDIRPGLDIEAPRGYNACLDAASWRSMIVMEDIAVSKGASFVSTETYFTRPMAESYLANMARWHGRMWNSPRFGNDLAHLRTPLQFQRNLNNFLSVPQRAQRGVERSDGRIPEPLRGRTDKVFDTLMRSFERNATLVPTLLHGDAHIGQTYLTREGHVGIGDWSGVLRGYWAYDYAYGLASILTVSDRRAWERDLLGFYLDRLHAEGGDKVSFDEAWLAYRQHLPYPYITWLMTLVGESAMTPEMQPRRVSLDIVERTAHAIDDLETLKSFD